ncbi:MAG: MotA/TolQ/ExbB proton channel family protein [Alphaproteobacteria bacterium]|nr:MotA/TolQ/ExbB proton channel family protein [Alphaproteobacteria bacterium]
MSNFSFIYLLFQSGWFIQLLSFMLIAVSVYSWAIIFEKWKTYRLVQENMNAFEKDFFSHDKKLDSLFATYQAKPQQSPLARIFLTAMGEIKKTNPGKKMNLSHLRGRLEKMMLSSIETEVSYLQNNISVLSVASSTAPFIGLFGTVWGIMQSFSAIGSAGNANLSVLAPGIATALSTTALGLIVAIPAAVGSHYFSRRLSQIENKMLAFSVELEGVISRNLEADGHVA